MMHPSDCELEMWLEHGENLLPLKHDSGRYGCGRAAAVAVATTIVLLQTEKRHSSDGNQAAWTCSSGF